MSTILVLGGGGFLGEHIAAHFRARGWRVVAVGHSAAIAKADATHVWSLPHQGLAHLLAVEQPDIVVNAAGRASVPASIVEPLADFEGSALLTFRLLDDLRRRCPQAAFIHISSAAVYGDPERLPVAETARIEPISPYGWHKRLSELVLEEHARQFGMRTASLRLFSAFGPRLHRQVVWDLANKAIAGTDGPLVLQGLPEDSRDFIHGADVAAAIEAVVARGALTGESYNVAAGCETPIHDVGRMILAALGRDNDIVFDQQRRPGNPSRWHADINKLRALGFVPKIDLVEGVAEVVRAAQERNARARI